MTFVILTFNTTQKEIRNTSVCAWTSWRLDGASENIDVSSRQIKVVKICKNPMEKSLNI